MPQFDIFSFFSQLFWVFIGFISLYLLLTFYLLPSLSTILKIRKRKLAQVTSSTTSTSLSEASSDTIFTNTAEWSNIAGVQSSILTNSLFTNYESNSLSLSILKAKIETFRKYKVPIVLWFVENSQRTTQGFSKNAISVKNIVHKKFFFKVFVKDNF
jgi:hypothetical protein